MVSVIRTFTVDKPMKEVVEYLADFSHAAAWDPGTRSCVRTDDGPLAVGSTWHNVSEFRGKEARLSYRLVQREDNRLVFQGENKSATSTDNMTFTPVESGTSISYQAHIEFHGIIKLFGWIAQAEFNRLGDETVVQMTRVINAL